MNGATSPVQGTVTDIGVIGGSGFYSLFEEAVDLQVATPFGEPSAPVSVGEIAGRRVAFLPRHGRDHRFPPHRINYRANLWALGSLGVRQVLGPCAVGSLRPDLGPGALVVPDQLVDRTTHRVQTFNDDGAFHVSFADPYCPTGRSAVLDASRAAGWEPADGGTIVVIEGPRFSTRAESRWYAAQGWTVVNMTGHPEAVLARELAMCYTAVGLVTDVDAGVVPGDGVTMAEVFDVFERNVSRLRGLIADVVRTLPAERSCSCQVVPGDARPQDGHLVGADSPW